MEDKGLRVQLTFWYNAPYQNLYRASDVQEARTDSRNISHFYTLPSTGSHVGVSHDAKTKEQIKLTIILSFVYKQTLPSPYTNLEGSIA